MKLKALATTAILPLVLLPGMAMATNGYFSHGYGVKSQGMAGVGIALPQDGLAAATNPAGTAFVGDRLDLGLVWFRPSRGAEIRGNGPNTPQWARLRSTAPMTATTPRTSSFRNSATSSIFPRNSSASVAVYGNGGMNTDYGNSPFTNFGGASGPGGVDLSQLFISPSLALKVNENHALGIAINFAYQRFKIEGIQPFADGNPMFQSRYPPT